MDILFVCAGNIVRSVIAECVFRRKLEETPGKASGLIEIASSGIEAEDNSAPHPDCIRALEALGINSCDTTSTRADEEHMDRSDLVITMTRQQSYVIAGKFPDYRHKCFSLIEINGVIETILDTRGGRPGDYEPFNDFGRLNEVALREGLSKAASTLQGVRRESMRPLAGVPLSIQELMTRFAPCFYQVSGVHDPLGGTLEEVVSCAQQIDSEVTLLLRGLLALAASESGEVESQ